MTVRLRHQMHVGALVEGPDGSYRGAGSGGHELGAPCEQATPVVFTALLGRLKGGAERVGRVGQRGQADLPEHLPVVGGQTPQLRRSEVHPFIVMSGRAPLPPETPAG